MATHPASPTSASSTAPARSPTPAACSSQGNRIRRVGRSSAALAPTGATVIDGAGATLMPGMCEAHTHFSWNDAATLAAIQTMPLEEHVLWCAKVAKRYLEAGWTSCVGAACAKPRLDVVIRNAINAGPDPRAALSRGQPGDHRRSAASATRRCRTCPFPEFSFGVNVNSRRRDAQGGAPVPEVRRRLDQAQPLGRQLHPHSPAETTWMSDDEVAAAMGEVRVRGKRGTAHARSAASVKQALRHGIDVIYHASYTDDEALDMLEAAKDRVFVAPGIAILYAMLYEAEPWGITHAKAVAHGLPARVGGSARVAARDAQARHPHPARRRLRLRVDAARPERARPGVLRQVPRHDADGGDPLGHALRRPDHDEAGRARHHQGRLPRRPAAGRRRPARQPRRSCATRSGSSR